ncbi:hypothetical protein [Herbaspirillum aquaticum]|uniref:hypothetical protein n=1 Tax=Herbaspirillum aquaticum TaxID=568783 RepID=UPI0024DE7FF2|nr:hypothetical protein [Herbaspirillum aquaticum]
MTFVEEIKSVPDVIWSGILGACLALGGTLITNIIAYRSLKARISFETEEAARKRKADTRKEVYLNAADELVKTNFHLAGLIRNPQSDGGNALSGFASATSKLMLLMCQQDALELSRLNALYSGLVFKLIPRLQPISNLNTSIQITQKWIDRTNEEISRILSEQTRLTENGPPDPIAFDRLVNSYESHRALVAKFEKDKERANQQLLPLFVEANLFLTLELQTIQPQLVKVIMAMRRDFEVGGEEDVFLREAQRVSAMATEGLTKCLAELTQTKAS